jgi:hypothetical protein
MHIQNPLVSGSPCSHKISWSLYIGYKPTYHYTCSSVHSLSFTLRQLGPFFTSYHYTCSSGHVKLVVQFWAIDTDLVYIRNKNRRGSFLTQDSLAINAKGTRTENESRTKKSLCQLCSVQYTVPFSATVARFFLGQFRDTRLFYLVFGQEKKEIANNKEVKTRKGGPIHANWLRRHLCLNCERWVVACISLCLHQTQTILLSFSRNHSSAEASKDKRARRMFCAARVTSCGFFTCI